MLELFGQVADGLRRVSNYKIWQDGNHPELLITPKFARQKLSYIHDNLVAKEIVDEPENYLFSSARDYYSNCFDVRLALKVLLLSKKLC